MNVVRARLGHCQEDATGGSSVFRTVGIRQDPEFLQSVRIREIDAAIVHQLDQRGPIEQDIVVGVSRSGNVDCRSSAGIRKQ